MDIQSIVNGVQSHTGYTIGILISPPMPFPFINESLPRSREIKQKRQIILVPFTLMLLSISYLFLVSKMQSGEKIIQPNQFEIARSAGKSALCCVIELLIILVLHCILINCVNLINETHV